MTTNEKGTAENASSPDLIVEPAKSGVLLVHLSGNWSEPAVPDSEVIRKTLREDPSVKALAFDTGGVSGWDSRFVALIGKCVRVGRERGIEVRCAGLPEGVRRLLHLANLLPEKKDARHVAAKVSFLEKLGERTRADWEGLVGLFTFLGENLTAFWKLLRGRAQFRWADAFVVMEQTGPQALAIVAMINFLVGLILAFVGATELQRFGAAIYTADLVAIATVREMSCIMTGIILCGRTGAAFAAQLGTMKVNEELNALQTFGISPIEFLVLPRMVALMLMMPFLCIFADLISIAGGFVVSVGMLDVTSTVYLNRTIGAIQLKSFLLGIFKGSFFGFLVAYTGCLRGMQSGYTAAAVGEAATRAVVTGIAAIIAFDGVFAVLCNALGI
jgi:phospholipid/cholesterol/gamma-HCH transport system permease protein